MPGRDFLSVCPALCLAACLPGCLAARPCRWHWWPAAPAPDCHSRSAGSHQCSSGYGGAGGVAAPAAGLIRSSSGFPLPLEPTNEAESESSFCPMPVTTEHSQPKPPFSTSQPPHGYNSQPDPSYLSISPLPLSLCTFGGPSVRLCCVCCCFDVQLTSPNRPLCLPSVYPAPTILPTFLLSPGLLCPAPHVHKSVVPSLPPPFWLALAALAPDCVRPSAQCQASIECSPVIVAGLHCWFRC